MVVVERNRAAHVFIGSANATSAAFGGNVEFVVELLGGATKIGVDSFLNDDTGFAASSSPTTPPAGRTPTRDEELHATGERAAQPRRPPVHPDLVTRRLRLSGAADQRTPLPVPDGRQATADLLTMPGNAGLSQPTDRGSHDGAHWLTSPRSWRCASPVRPV